MKNIKKYNNYKISQKNPFPEIVRSNFELDDIEQRKLFKETHQMKYYYSYLHFHLLIQ